MTTSASPTATTEPSITADRGPWPFQAVYASSHANDGPLMSGDRHKPHPEADSFGADRE